MPKIKTNSGAKKSEEAETESVSFHIGRCSKHSPGEGTLSDEIRRKRISSI